MDKLTSVFLFLIFLISILSYSERRESPEILFFAFVMATAMLGMPRLFEYLKERGKVKKEAVAEKPEWKELKARLENLEGVMCRLDEEINSQLESSLSAGRLITSTGPGGMSQMPTTFMNVATSLEGRYQVLKELGRGGMGIVFQAYDKQLKEQVAIKILSPLLSNNTEALERLKLEVSAARRVTHANVIRIHDISEINGLHFVSMEYFQGQNLKEYIRQSGELSMMQAFQIASQLCEGLDAAHRQSVIHRDLKSQNIIINLNNHIKIIDFGLARTAQREGMTATGLIMGTPEYMAPEQVAGKKVDERADIYSLGIILYELFTGRVPFEADSAIAVGFKQVKEDPPAPSSFNPQISSEVETIILRALQKEPLKRYRSVAELRAELENAVLKPVSQLPVITTERKGGEAKHTES
jgi:serine/threonine protein kinase